MDEHAQAQMIANDLDNLRIRIEALPADPGYTDALNAATTAKCQIIDTSAYRHHAQMKERFAKADAA